MNKLKISLLISLFPLCSFAQTDAKFDAYEQVLPGTEVNFKMVPVQGGKFLLGSPETEANRKADEGPQVEVTVDPFWMGAFEVTFDVFDIFRNKEKDQVGASASWNADAITRPSPPYEDPTFGMGKNGFPAGSMTQYSALLFCKWLTEKTGVFYRLPTEAEWEYACKAGTTTAYPHGDDVAQLAEYAWYYENSNEVFHKVGTKKPNAWGLYDMNGNLAEWTLDQYKADYYASLGAKSENPWAKPTSLHPRTVRGGNYNDDPDKLRCSCRTESNMKWKRRDPQIPKSFWWNTDSPFVGFRLVRPLKQPTAEEIDKFWKANLDG